MKEKLKNTKGITLIALVITIIILLILAMVSISLVMNTGIINRANNAVQAYNEAQINELQQLNTVEDQMSQYDKKTSNSDLWYDLTEEEKKQLEANQGMIAEVHGEKELLVGEMGDWREVEEVQLPLITIMIGNDEKFGVFTFAIEDCDSNKKSDFGYWNYSFKKDTWYVNTTDGSQFTSDTMKEYTGKSPITMQDFEGGQIYCESILQKIIDALNK